MRNSGTLLVCLLASMTASAFLMGCLLEETENGEEEEEETKANLMLADLEAELSENMATVEATFSLKAEGQIEKSIKMGIQVKKGTEQSWAKEWTLSAESMNSLNQGQTVFESQTITLPDWGSGDYTISVVVDKPDEIDEEDETDNTLESSVTVEIRIPAAPSELTKTGDLPCAIAWRDNSDNEDGFNIYLGSSCGDVDMVSSWRKVVTVGPNTTSYSWTKSCCSVAECSWVLVRAFNDSGESEDSNSVRLAPLC